MDKEYVEKYNLNEGRKRFQALLEYSFNEGIREEGEDENDPSQGGAPMPPANPSQGGAPMPPADPSQGGAPMPPADPSQGGAPMPPADPSQGGAPAPTGADAFNPQTEAGAVETTAPEAPAPETEGGEDEVVDVDELTSAQEETNDEVRQVSDKFDDVMSAIKGLENMIKQNDDSIMKLNAEMEKRNPTDLEKMSLRSKDSYPFNVSTDDFWKEKEATSNYRTDDDNNGVGQEKYTIYQKDIDDVTDWNEVAHSLEDEDSDLYQPLNKIFGL